MKKSIILLVLLITCSFAQAQITPPQDVALPVWKPTFSLELNAGYSAHQGVVADLNLGVELKRNTSLYFGVGTNGLHTQYLRLGMMKQVISHDRFTLSVGAGLRF